VIGHRGELAGLNVVGLKRRGVSRSAIHALRNAYRDIFFGSGTFADRVEATARAHAEDANVMRVVEFIRATGKRRLSLPRQMSDGD
jgi:UDP-N-acetylglucosamine acyltransferase